eukprot:TRINITY_DN17893_c0_g1_i6.p1 TRINITY_DN17893_c0_g1~~TRINITY_DN17893_c0_g1_i6.p1  ORF type:complete len:294 (+),score=82.12 TRINITY_DN17893_c0_g1_i6:431-1312(+)
MLFPKRMRKQREAMSNGTLCQFLQKQSTGMPLDGPELEFVLRRLRELPFFEGLSEDDQLLLSHHLKVTYHVPGTDIFKQGEKVTGLCILVIGILDLVNEDGKSLQLNLRKEASYAMQTTDVFDTEDIRPYVLREGATWQRTAKVAMDDEMDSLAMCVFVPLTALQMLSDRQREKESKEMDEIIGTKFAKAARQDPNLCLKAKSSFRIKVFGKNELVLQDAAKPALSDARIALVLRGELQSVKRVGTKVTKDTHENRNLLGQEALYGEPYSKSYVTVTEVRIVFTVQDVSSKVQ